MVLANFFEAIRVWLLTVPCCSKKCLRKLSVEDISSSELQHTSLDQTERRSYVLTYLNGNSRIEDSGTFLTEFVVKEKKVCREALFLIHNINKEWFLRHLNKFKEGAVEVEPGNKNKKSQHRGLQTVLLAKILYLLCWAVPARQEDHSFAILLYLPETHNIRSIRISQFQKIFKEHFPHVDIPKVLNSVAC